MAIELVPGSQIKNYILDRRLGKGASGEVWRASDGLKTVAIKFMNEDLMKSAQATKHRTRLEREVQSMLQLQHPNIPTLYDYDLDYARPYLVMRYVGGDSYDKLIADGRMLRIPLERRIELLHELALALTVAHEAGIIHRDIKPANITGTENPYLLDFSIAVAKEDMLQTARHLGTSRYMAPEGSADRLSDNYSFALVAYEMLFGTHAIFRPSDRAFATYVAATRIESGDWRWPSGVPRDELPADLRGADLSQLDHVFQKAIGPRDQRYRDLRHFINELRTALGLATISTFPTAPPVAPAPPVDAEDERTNLTDLADDATEAELPTDVPGTNSVYQSPQAAADNRDAEGVYRSSVGAQDATEVEDPGSARYGPPDVIDDDDATHVDLPAAHDATEVEDPGYAQFQPPDVDDDDATHVDPPAAHDATEVEAPGDGPFQPPSIHDATEVEIPRYAPFQPPDVDDDDATHVDPPAAHDATDAEDRDARFQRPASTPPPSRFNEPTHAEFQRPTPSGRFAPPPGDDYTEVQFARSQFGESAFDPNATLVGDEGDGFEPPRDFDPLKTGAVQRPVERPRSRKRGGALTAVITVIIMLLVLIGGALAGLYFTGRLDPFSAGAAGAGGERDDGDAVIVTEPVRANPTEMPLVAVTDEPTVEPTAEPTVEPTDEPTVEPTVAPTSGPTDAPATAADAACLVSAPGYVRVYSQPDPTAMILRSLPQDDRTFRVVATTGDTTDNTTWLQIDNADLPEADSATELWVRRDAVELSGDCDEIDIQTDAATPPATATTPVQPTSAPQQSQPAQPVQPAQSSAGGSSGGGAAEPADPVDVPEQLDCDIRTGECVPFGG